MKSSPYRIVLFLILMLGITRGLADPLPARYVVWTGEFERAADQRVFRVQSISKLGEPMMDLMFLEQCLTPAWDCTKFAIDKGYEDDLDPSVYLVRYTFQAPEESRVSLLADSFRDAVHEMFVEGAKLGTSNPEGDWWPIELLLEKRIQKEDQ